jgi:hypothetical protein
MCGDRGIPAIAPKARQTYPLIPTHPLLIGRCEMAAHNEKPGRTWRPGWSHWQAERPLSSRRR